MWAPVWDDNDSDDDQDDSNNDDNKDNRMIIINECYWMERNDQKICSLDFWCVETWTWVRKVRGEKEHQGDYKVHIRYYLWIWITS